jgi:lipoprotein-releasing system permease protein
VNFELFIARRFLAKGKSGFTWLIIRIAVAAIALSICVMLLAVCIIAGFKNEIHNKLFGFWGHIHITDTNINRNFELRSVDKNLPYYESIKNIGRIEYQEQRNILGVALPGYNTRESKGGINHVQPSLIVPGLIETNDFFQAILFKGVDDEFNWKNIERYIIDGRKIELPADSSSSEILISKIISDKMELELGDKVLMSFIKDNNRIRRRFEIVGIYNTGLEEYDRRFLVGDMRKMQQFLQWPANEVSTIEIFLDQPEDMALFSEYLYYNELPPKLYAESVEEKFHTIFDWLKFQDINEKVILGLMAIVAIINMMTVLLILILERTESIGLLKSLGATNNSIRKIFLYNAAYMILLGQLLGNLIGLSLALLQKHTRIIKLDEASYYLDSVPIEIHIPNIILINLIAFVLSFVFLLVPSTLVARIKPVKALRFT